VVKEGLEHARLDAVGDADAVVTDMDRNLAGRASVVTDIFSDCTSRSCARRRSASAASLAARARRFPRTAAHFRSRPADYGILARQRHGEHGVDASQQFARTGVGRSCCT
jgi:hypothetical protein